MEKEIISEAITGLKVISVKLLLEALREFPNQQRVEKVCVPGSGAKTCRYLTMGGSGWDCAKTSSLRRALDERASEMNAKGDNCGGLLELILANQELLQGREVIYEESMPSFRSTGLFKNIEQKGRDLIINWKDGDAKNTSFSKDYLAISVDGSSITFEVAGLGNFAGRVQISLA